MSLFRNKYLDTVYFQPPEWSLLKQLESYYEEDYFLPYSSSLIHKDQERNNC